MEPFQRTVQKIHDILGELMLKKKYFFLFQLCVSESIYNKKEKSIRKYLIERILKYFNLESTAINEIWEESENINEAITLLQEVSQTLSNIKFLY